MVVKPKSPRAHSSGTGHNGAVRKRSGKPKHRRSAAFAPAPSTANQVEAPIVGDERSTRAYLIAQEIKMAKLFAGNDTKLSEKQLKRLRRWLQIRSSSSFPFDRNNFMRIWKGLFYSMWMSDKPLPQEQLADNIASLLHAFPAPSVAIEFFGAFLQTMSAEWFGIDQWRIDKFMMLVRRVARQQLVVLHRAGWPLELLQQLNAQLATTVLRSAGSIGFFMHFTELWLEEVAKVSAGQIAAEAVTELVRPFGAYLGRPRDPKLCRHVVKHVYNWLLFQSEAGREYQERFEAWKGTGFAGNTIEAMQKVEVESEEEEAEDEDDDAEATANGNGAANGNGSAEDDHEGWEDEEEEEEELDEQGEPIRHLDPRAGRVDVYMTEMPFDAVEIVRALEEEKLKQHTNVKSRQQLQRVINNYTTFAAGQFPLGIQQIKLKSDQIELPRLEDKVNEIVLFEKKLRAQNDAVRNLNKRNRRKLLAGKPVSATALAKAKAKAKPVELTPELVASAKHKHRPEGGCCGGHDEPAKKRRSVLITPAEKLAIKQWEEEDIEEPEEQPAAEVVIASPKRKKKAVAVAAEDEAEVELAPEAEASPPLAKKKKSSKAALAFADPWAEPLQEGELEFSQASRKQLLRQLAAAEAREAAETSAISVAKAAAKALTPQKVVNPAAVARLKAVKAAAGTASAPATPVQRRKSVQIKLEMNKSQEKSEYFKQLRDSPNTPYDAQRVPPKGVLKPNLMPSPINPYYRKKIGLSFE